MFIKEINPVTSHTVAITTGKWHASSRVGIECWLSRDDKGTKHEYLVKNVLYFPQNLTNILSVTEFAKQFKDTEGTSIDTKELRSCFYWDRYKFKLTSCHPNSNLPVLSINERFFLAWLYQAMFTKTMNTSISCKHSCHFTKVKDIQADINPEMDRAETADVHC